jgi:hypothetical protein
MKASKTGLCVYRGLYWANQGLLNAARALEQAEVEVLRTPWGVPVLGVVFHRRQAAPHPRHDRRNREVMNRILAEGVEREQ